MFSYTPHCLKIKIAKQLVTTFPSLGADTQYKRKKKDVEYEVECQQRTNESVLTDTFVSL